MDEVKYDGKKKFSSGDPWRRLRQKRQTFFVLDRRNSRRNSIVAPRLCTLVMGEKELMIVD